MDEMRVTLQDDVDYVRANYVEIATACRRAGADPLLVSAQIERGERPGPAYILADGTRYVPEDYFAQVTERRVFEQRALAQADLRRIVFDRAQLDALWTAYMKGTYAVCLRHASPEGIVDKQYLIAAIAAMLEEPRAQDAEWLARLHELVDSLDDVEREFCAFDRTYFGRPVSRDTYVTNVRARYPRAVFV